MTQIEKIKAEIERRKNQFVSQAEAFHKIGKEDKESYYAALASNMNSLSCFLDTLEEGPVSNDLEEAADNYVGHAPEIDEDLSCFTKRNAFIAGAQWQKENLWKNAQGDDLPEIDREVIVLARALPEHEDSLLKVSFAHRPPEYWMGKNIGTGEITRYEPMRYDKGQWNIPAVVWWLDVELPNEEE